MAGRGGERAFGSVRGADVDTVSESGRPGRTGQLACWEHWLPLARYALIGDGEQIRSAMYPGSFAGPQ
jgi:hypothetical protein